MRHKKLRARILSFALSVAMVCSMLPATVFAAEGDAPLGASGITECHPAHNEDCGYIAAVEGQPCGDLNEDGTYTCAPIQGGDTATPGNASRDYVCDHSDGCGCVEAVEEVSCIHSCELCEVKDSGAPRGIGLRAGIVTGDGYTFAPDTGTLTVTGEQAMAYNLEPAWTTDGGGLVARDAVTTLVLDDAITTIPQWAFYNCFNLTSITWSNSLVTIGDGTFGGTDITTLTLPSNVTSIGESAFNCCTSLQTITLNDKLESIGGSAFADYTTFTSIEIPSSVTSIGNTAFFNNSALTTVTMKSETPCTIGDDVFPSDNTGFKIKVPAGTGDTYKAATGWSDYAAYIEEEAGGGTATGTNCSFTNGTLTITGNTFALPSGVNKTDVTAVIFTDAVTSVDSKLDFYTELLTVTFTDNITSICEEAFQMCSKLTAVVLPANLTEIQVSTFNQCNALASVTFGDKITSITTTAFNGCNLTSVEIPASVTNIEYAAFFGNQNLTSVTMKGSTPPTVYYDYTSGSDQSTFPWWNTGFKIHVPAGAVGTYKNNSGWSGYAPYIVLPNYTGPQAAAPSSTPAEKKATSVKLAPVAVTGETVEYAYSTTSTAPTDNSKWQTSPEFTGLTADTQYYFFARVKANDNHKAGIASAGTAIKTDKTDAAKVADAKTKATTALGNLTATNATTADEVLAAVNSALAGTGVTATWKAGSGFNKTNATNAATGSVTGVITLTLNGITIDVTVSLTIAKLTTLADAITAANNAKNGISVNDNPASSVASGTKFVTTAEMNALNAAITAAQNVLSNSAASEADVNAAVSALNSAVATFNAAIKTGTYSGGGGGGSSSSDNNNSATIVPPTSQDKPNDPTKAEVKTPATVDTKGNGTVTISEKDMTDAVTKAIDDAKKTGKQNDGVSVQFVVSTGGKSVNTLTINLPKMTQERAITGKVQEMAVIMEGTNITVGFNLAAITEINRQAQADVQLTTTRLDNSKLSGEAKAAIGSRPVFDVAATYANGTKNVDGLGNGQMMIEIPYKLQKGEVAGNLYGIYVDGNGKATYLTNSSYDVAREVLIIGTNHNSVYGVGYKATAPEFSDTINHWAKSNIDFVASRGLMSGTSNTTFNPDATMTRGMFATALGRLAGIDVNGYKTGKFTDVAATAYYAPYVNWAADKDIVSGTSNTTFAPDAAITREQMAVIMNNYAKVMGYTVPKTREEAKFTDAASIGSYAKDAVKAMQMAGIINGKNGNTFDPKANATRAEVAAVLHRYVELVIDRATAQGWTTNDSGSSLYYSSGKALVGAQTIGGVAYTFNAYGETTRKSVTAGVSTTQALPADGKKYILYTVKPGDWLSKIAKEHDCTVEELVALNGITNKNLIVAGQQIKVPRK